ncbi:MAG: hypothetical protein QW470_03795 [Candidatus Caldarchaeum sp.]
MIVSRPVRPMRHECMGKAIFSIITGWEKHMLFGCGNASVAGLTEEENFFEKPSY